MNPGNFAQEMESVRRIIFSLLTLLFCSISGFSEPTSNSAGWFRLNDFNPFEQNGKVGLKNQKGDILIPAQYDALGWSDGSFSVVENVTGYSLNGKWGLVNLTNHKVTKPEFQNLLPGDGSMIIARKALPNSFVIQSGCITPSGKVVIPFQYDGIRFSNLRAIVYRKEQTRFKHGLIDFANNVLIPLNYQSIYPLGSLRFAVVSFDNKTAIYSEEGEQLSAFAIDSISSFKNNFAVIYQDQWQGLINREGKTILEPAYRDIRILDDGTIQTRKGDQWLFLDGDNKLIRECHADLIEPIERDLYKISISGLYQLINEQFTPLNSLFFTGIQPFQNGKCVFSVGDKKGVMRKNGSIVIAPKYTDLFDDGKFFRGSEITNRGLRWVLIDSAGNVITQKNYQYIDRYNGRFFPAQHKGFWGAIDDRGKEIAACVHDSLVQQKGEHIVVKFKGGYGIINTREEWIITPQKKKLRLINDKYYIQFESPNRILKSFAGDVIYFTQNKFEIQNDHLLEYLPSGEIWKVMFDGVITERYAPAEKVEKIFDESEGYRAIKRDGKYGFIDNRSRLRIANRYEDVQAFSEGLAGAKILGKWGYVNKEDKIAIQPVYEQVSPFSNGFAIVRTKNLYGLINKKGKLILPLRYDQIDILPGNLFRIRQNALYGVANAEGKILLNTKFDNLNAINDYFIIERAGKFGVVDSAGLSTIPLIYDALTFNVYSNQFIAVKKCTWEPAAF